MDERANIDGNDVQAFLSDLAERPDLWDKDSELDPREASILASFQCLEDYPFPAIALLCYSGSRTALARLTRSPFLTVVQPGDPLYYPRCAPPLDGTIGYALTHAGHEAEHRFLQANWRKLRDYPARLGCGTCGPNGHVIDVG